MEKLWWEQVGPRRFCTQVIRCLRSASVAACFPRFTVENLLVGLDGFLDGTNCYFDAEDGPDPIALLQADIGGAEGDLIDSILDRNGLFIIKNITPSSWPAWCAFVEGYHRRLSAVNPHKSDSVRFLLLCRGVPEESLRPSGVDLRIVQYKGVVGLLDTEQYCAGNLGSNVVVVTEGNVKAAIIAQLSLGDKGLADWLCNKELPIILSPASTLRKFAEERRITAEAAGCWHKGTMVSVDGRTVESSVLLAVKNDLDELNRRIWLGQLKILFPYIEERRLEFVSLVRNHLNLPREANLIEFEIARIGWFISNHCRAEDRLSAQIYIDIARAFGKVRNCLAHQSHAPADYLERMFQASARLDDLIMNGPIVSPGPKLRGSTAS